MGAAVVFWSRRRRAPLLFALALHLPMVAVAQSSCTRNGNGNCRIGNNATYAITITVTRAIRPESSSSIIALASPSAPDFIAGFGQTTGPTLTMKSNAAYTITIRTTQGTWTASPAPARPNKPSGDLQWGTAAGGPFADFTTTAVTAATGAAATAGRVVPLFFRVKYSWLLDTTGNYSLPIQLTVTSP